MAAVVTVIAIAVILFSLRVFINVSRNIENAGFSTPGEKIVSVAATLAAMGAGYVILAIAEICF